LMATVGAYERGDAGGSALSAALYGAITAAGCVLRRKGPNGPDGMSGCAGFHADP
jgi:hypothetical protein